MKKLIFIFVLICLFSCSEYIDKPKNLIDKDKMSEIIADLAINDQVTYLYPGSNLESGTRFILKNHQVKTEDFVASYRYYIVKQKMTGIVEDAQKIILEKDPKSEKTIKGDTRLKDIELPKLERR
ncbi:DUF4296 domain-containing protein [Chryseobacterium indoltheticum]|uniref:DUF4296 domain-containing protein n=1 Tax=Chryseobacterium indoltheticum TaxID=254 RepID=A0A381F730_9FLAO|nr:DUF4296 domain-containing protein [Chryseobacterium indoltheticum]AZA72739.1 DUF4296 domain-containing protein [Chryseobacterium indoltheticum]SIP86460.1 protein of unknown function [Chryseobacterium indoltheticum]SUX42335.1 Uncharacterised protein [Chryseobacterium indoltheticum]